MRYLADIFGNDKTRDYTWFAATPSAAWAMQKANISYNNLELFQEKKPSDFIEAITQKQTTWARNFDICVQINTHDSFGFFPARYYLYYLKNTWDTLIHRWNILDRLYDHYPFDEIVFFGNTTVDFDNISLELNGSFTSLCIQHWADIKNIGIRMIDPIPDDAFFMNRATSNGGFKSKLGSLPFMHPIADILKICVGSLSRIRYKNNSATRPLILKRHYDITDSVWSELEKRSMRLIDFDDITRDLGCDKHPNINANNLWGKLRSQNWFYDVGFETQLPKEIIDRFHKHFLYNTVPDLYSYYKRSKTVLNNINPRAIVAGNIFGVRDTALIMAARNRTIPVIFYTHGANAGDVKNTTWGITDTFYGDYLLVYGNGMKRFVQSHSGDNTALAVPVGSSRIDMIHNYMANTDISNLKRKLNLDLTKPTYLYVPGVLRTNFYRYQYYNSSCTRTFDIRKSVMRLFNNYPEVQVIYKPFVFEAEDDPTEEMISEICSSCKIVKNVPLNKLQYLSDMIIHEAPSTGLYEAVVTDKPILVYIDANTWDIFPNAEDMMRKRVTVATSGSDFLKCMEDILISGKIPDKKPDTTFAKHFITFRNDGKSSQRAAEEIKRISAPIESPRLRR